MEKTIRLNSVNICGASRYCRLMLTGVVEAPKLCTLNYECCHCAFDQWLDDFESLLDKKVVVNLDAFISQAV